MKRNSRLSLILAIVALSLSWQERGEFVTNCIVPLTSLREFFGTLEVRMHFARQTIDIA